MDLKKTTTVHITYGLPGSGKTYWCAKKIWSSYVNLDLNGDKKELVKKGFRLSGGIPIKVCIDGLITTHASLAAVIHDVINTIEAQKDKRDIVITVHVWNEDRETCLYNDYKRREVGSEASIKNMPYEAIDCIEDIWRIAGNNYVSKAEFLYEKHYVKQKPEYKKWFEENCGIDTSAFITDNHIGAPETIYFETLKSNEWCLGGSYGNYLGATEYISAENPVYFSELYDLLLSIDENIPYRIVKNVEKFIKTEERHVDDYYSEGCNYAHYEINYSDIYDVIKQWREETA